jgi:hypothetical protein
MRKAAEPMAPAQAVCLAGYAQNVDGSIASRAVV